jgi:hypothetical protein
MTEGLGEMGTAKEPKPVKLIASIFSTDPALIDRAQAALAARFGPVDFASELLPFDHTNYYEPEFGAGILRRIVAFERLVDPGSLPDIKLATNAIEAEISAGGGRAVNMDPGYVGEGKMILATTKDHRHRIYLGKGIYGEVTLYYHQGTFHPWEWTYADYASPHYCDIFTRIRTHYREQLRQM